jgi:hypothetical protein
MGNLIASPDAILCRVGGVPAYLLRDNAKAVTVEHGAEVDVTPTQGRRGPGRLPKWGWPGLRGI